jgi:hypothetical protein
VNNHLQSGFWLRGGFLSSSRRGGFSDGHLHQLGGSPSGPCTSGVKFSIGNAAEISLPSASAPVNKKASASATTTTLWGYYSNSRVLTFDHAGFWQRSLSSRHFELRLRGWSELLGGRRDFFFRHRRRGFIPLPGQIRQLPAEYTSRLSVKQDYYIKVLLGKIQHLQA